MRAWRLKGNGKMLNEARENTHAPLRFLRTLFPLFLSLKTVGMLAKIFWTENSGNIGKA